MEKLTNCAKCSFLKATPALNFPIYGCNETGLVVPHHTETTCNTIITTFNRVPMECPLSDDRVVKTPLLENIK